MSKKLKSKLLASQQGQASIMIGMMMLTFMLFFTFVVNTGMLVNAKINLQNAADLAAYAGAATQARQLNQISYLNYEMRRQYKKFLFRYYVMGNLSQKGFPAAPGGKTAHTWSPDGGATNYKVPTVCLIFNASDNYCQVATLPAIPKTPTSPTDLINQTLNEQLQALEGIREANCGRIAQANVNVLLLWLYNTDPLLQDLPATLSDPNASGIIQVTSAVSQGLGLVPREIILRQRIKTLESYVNASPMQAVSKGTADGLKTSQDPVLNERTMQAFYSAYYTLGPNIFDDQYVQMDELMPSQGDGANLLNLSPIEQDFDSYAVGYQIPPAGSTGAGNCNPVLIPVPVRKVPIGFAKDPSILTYYAIRLTAQAKVMFSPFGDMTIKAYSAARPFGSRIGPPYSGVPEQFSYAGQGNLAISSSSPPFLSTALTGNIPNLPVTPDDKSAAATGGWNTDFMLGSMYQAMFPGGSATSATVIGSSQAAAGYQAAMAANLPEGNLYNIVNDEGNDPFVHNFDTSHQLKFWAPVFPPGQQASLQTQLHDALQEILAGGSPLITNSIVNTSASDAQMQAALLADMVKYLGTLSSSGGENGEGMNIATLTDPFTGSDGQPLKLSPDIMMQTPDQYKTSWVTTNFSDYQTQGRVGYSVKFVSFDSLTNHKNTSNGAATWTNGPTIDEQAKIDGLLQIQH